MARTMRVRGLVIAVMAVALAAALSAPAFASPVLVVDGDHVRRADDPFVPPAPEVDLGPAPGRARHQAISAAGGGGGVSAALARAYRAHAISRTSYAGYRRTFGRARSTLSRLSGARRRELGYVVQTLERLAQARRLTPSRMPAQFLGLRRNAAYWPSKRFPAVGDQIEFKGSELLFQYFPGRGLQFHPLSNFKKANLLHGACKKRTPGKAKLVCGARPPGPKPGTPCRPKRLAHLLDELSALAVHRDRRFIAWEYMFEFGGGSPPWISGMAEATAISAFGRASQLLGRPDYLATARSALGAFEVPHPAGVRARGPLGGVHYLQYSFAPRLFIFNAFMQALIGLHDYGKLAADPRATQLFTEAEPEARREVPFSDVGDWSRYNFRGHESSPLYHELLREILQGMGQRLGGIYCDYAIRYRGYQTDPPKVVFQGPRQAVHGRVVGVRFSLSKLSVVELKVYRGHRVVHRGLATLRQGNRSLPWRADKPGTYVVRLGAKELRTGRSKRGRTSARVPVS